MQIPEACHYYGMIIVKIITKHSSVQISGEFKIDESGNVELKEEDGIDYAAVTVQLPGGERVPFLFTIKELEAKGTADAFGGEFVVPSYRGSSFLDPKVRIFFFNLLSALSSPIDLHLLPAS